jgi:hypothetical protein
VESTFYLSEDDAKAGSGSISPIQFIEGDQNYYVRTQLRNGSCHKVNVLQIKFGRNAVRKEFQEICEGQEVEFYDKTFLESGIYTVSVTSPGAFCDSTITLELTVNPLQRRTESVSLCDVSFYVFNGDTLRDAGIYEYRKPSTEGCDSLIVIDIKPSNAIVEVSPLLIASEIGETHTIEAKTLRDAGNYRWEVKLKDDIWRTIPAMGRIEGQGTRVLSIKDVKSTDHESRFRLIVDQENCPDTSMVVLLTLKDTCAGLEPVAGMAYMYQRGTATCRKEVADEIIPDCWKWKYESCVRQYKFASGETRVRGVNWLLYNEEQRKLQTLINSPEYKGTRYLGLKDEYECFICLKREVMGRNATEYTSNDESAITSTSAVVVYPNPADDFVEILSAVKNVKIQKVIIHNYHGMMIREIFIDSESGLVDISLLPTGLYILRVEYTSGFENIKMVKR